ncbi:unnamed protein product [Withania somnifera]
MAKNQSTTKSDSQSQGTCRNIFRAFRRRVSPARPLATPSPISTNQVVASASNKVLIEYNHSNNAKRAEPIKPGPTNIHQQQQQNQPGPKSVKFPGGYSNNTSTDGVSNEKFTHFIDQMKKKIKANSSFVADENGPTAGTKRATTRRDSFNDRVSQFINRTKLKRRTTTATDHGDAKLQSYTPR